MKKEVHILSSKDGVLMAGCDQSACEGCKSSLFCRGKATEFEVANPVGVDVAEGDDVVIDMPSGRTVAASLMSLAFPLACFFIGLVACFFWIPGNEPLQLLGGFIGLAAGFLISALYFRVTRKRYTPVVERKVRHDEED